MTSSTTGAERVAQIREQAARMVKSCRDSVKFHEKGQKTVSDRARNLNEHSLEAARRDLVHAEAEVATLAGLSDLEVLNRALEQVARDRATVNDRLMKIYSARDKDIHGSAQAYREQAVRGFRDGLDGYVHSAMGRWAKAYMDDVLQAAAALPSQPNADQIAALKAAAHSARTLMSHATDNPAKAWERADHEGTVRRIRHHVRILGKRENLTAADVLRQIQSDLDGDICEFAIPNVGTEPAKPPPPFLGEHWRNRLDYHVYEPPGGARVLVCEGGDGWHVDLYAADGRLLAYGEAAEDEVAALAPALMARAAEWAGEPGYAWKRYAEVADRTRTAVAA